MVIMIPEVLTIAVIFSFNYRVDASQCLEKSLMPDQWNSDFGIEDLRLRDRSDERTLLLIAQDFVFTCEGVIERWAIRWSHREAVTNCATIFFDFLVFRQLEECGTLIVVGSNSFSIGITESSDSWVSKHSEFIVTSQKMITVRDGDFIGLIVSLHESRCSDIRVRIAARIDIQNTVYHGLFPSEFSLNLLQPCTTYTLNEFILPFFTAYLNTTVTPSSTSTTSTNIPASVTVGENGTDIPVTTIGMHAMSSSNASTVVIFPSSSSNTQSTDTVLYSSTVTLRTGTVIFPSSSSNTQSTDTVLYSSTVTLSTATIIMDMKATPSRDSTEITPMYNATTKLIGFPSSTSQKINSRCTQSSSTLHRVVESMDIRADMNVDMVIYVGVGVGICLIFMLVTSVTVTVLCIIRCTRPKKTFTVERPTQNGTKSDRVEQNQPIYDQPIRSMDDTYTIQTFECPSYDIESKSGRIMRQLEKSKNLSSDSLQQQRPMYQMTINEAYGSV